MNPNIVWINLDHIAFRQYRDFFKRQYPLRTYEHLAEEGIEFDRAYSVCPICCPARASMLTGKYPHNHGITQNGSLSIRNEPVADDMVLPQQLLDRGYRIAYFGKWHVGQFKKASDYGFEGWSLENYGHPYHSPEYKQYLKKKNLPQPEVDVEWCNGIEKEFHVNMCELKGYIGRDPGGYCAISAGRYNVPAEVDEAFFTADLACEWLESVEKTKPFFMRLDTWGPHQPYFVGQPFADTVRPDSIAEFENFVKDISQLPHFQQHFVEQCQSTSGRKSWKDWQPIIARIYEHMLQTDAAVGKVIDMLDTLKLTENTLIIYSADHGDITGSLNGAFDKGAVMNEETMQIPLVFKWPEVIKAGIKTQALVSNMDIPATILELLKSDKTKNLDGKSLMPLFDNPDNEFREVLMCEHFGHGFNLNQQVYYFKDMKLILKENDVNELFDLTKDPYEKHNLLSAPFNKRD